MPLQARHFVAFFASAPFSAAADAATEAFHAASVADVLGFHAGDAPLFGFGTPLSFQMMLVACSTEASPLDDDACLTSGSSDDETATTPTRSVSRSR